MFESHRQLTESVGSDMLAAGAKASPPVAVTALSAFGIGLQDWVFIATLVYIAVQLAHLIWRWRRG